MDLPGIGSFTLDAAAVIPQESDRMGQQPASGISFKNANIFTPDDALITYIKEHTGKMKSLAAADLDFYLTTGRQLLNIGKPFFIEGVGTLLKNKEGHLDFTPGDYLIPRINELAGPERERSRNSYDEPPREEPKANNVRQRQTMLLVLLIAGVVVVGWGGYYLYQRNNFSEQAGPENRATAIPDTPAAKSADTVAANPPATDTTTSKNPTVTGALTKADTAKADAVAAKPAAAPPVLPTAVPAVTPPAFVPHDPVPTEGQSLYHFVILRTPNKVHALRRYNQLLGFRLNIRMETKDSTFFKLYFPVAAVPRDTTHIKDSIADVYAANVVIEK